MHLFTECCDSIQVFYGSTNQEYTYGNIYGYYVRQEDLINGRAWYKNKGRSIWWDATDWEIGKTTEKGSTRGYAYLKNDGSCLPKISNPKWKLWDGSSWNDAGSQDVKIQCGSNTGKECYISCIKQNFSSFFGFMLFEPGKNLTVVDRLIFGCPSTFFYKICV